MENSKNRKAYIIGNGIAGLSAATFLIKDAGMKGCDIFILDTDSENGGSFDGQGMAEQGYLSRGYRMFEESIYLTTYDLLSNIPSFKNSQETLKDDFFEFNKKIKVQAKARLVKDGKIINPHLMELSWRDRLNLVKLLYLPEKFFGTAQIKNHFTTNFFKTNFWIEWSTTFAFEPWHSLIEMKRYLSRFVHVASQYASMTCVLSAPYCEHDFIILPLSKLLKENGVHFKYNYAVKDLEFSSNKNKKVVTEIFFQNSKNNKINVKESDLVFLTNGSMTADSSIGSMGKPPLPITKKSKAWDLWKNIAHKFED
ncbi:MAG: oleate hydratase, partial [Candidatus Gracilibacteria bacterium]